MGRKPPSAKANNGPAHEPMPIDGLGGTNETPSLLMRAQLPEAPIQRYHRSRGIHRCPSVPFRGFGRLSI